MYAIIILLAGSTGGVATVLWQLQARTDRLYQGMALQGTELEVQTLSAFRELYSKRVIARLEPEQVARNAEDHAQHGKIPLPATLTHLIGLRLGEIRAGAEVRLYSDYPFPGGSGRGPLDAFDRDALLMLRETPDKPYYRFEELGGRPVLRYAISDRLQAHCVTCHNTHPDSPKTDWKVGDVRGALEFIRPLDNVGPLAVAQAKSDLGGLFELAVLVAGLGVLGMALLCTLTLRKSRALQEQAAVTAFTADIGKVLTSPESLREILQRCAHRAVDRFDAAFARIWTLNEETQTLELQASAGYYTHIDGGHARVPVGKFKIGAIAANRRPHLSNQVVGDPQVGDQEWAKREGMVAFAGYPLIIQDRVVGVMAMFARHPFSTLVTDCLGSVADMIAVAISRQQTADQIQDYSQTLKRANVELEGQRQALEAQRHELETLNTHLARSQEKAHAAMNEAQQADRAKSEFLANMSHEIRTPMTAILGFADMLVGMSEDETLPQDGADAIQTIRRNGQHLLTLINDILDFSKIEAGQFQVERVKCSLPQTLADVQSTLRARASAQGLSLDIESVHPIPEVIQSDPTRLRQILMNLVGNAIKFTKSGGVRLVVRSIQDADGKPQLQFDVVDTGIGIDPAAVPRLFQPFAQADSTHTRRFGGTGLGLSISRRLAQMLGGDVDIVDTQPGLGTRFRVTIDPGPTEGVAQQEYTGDAISPTPPNAPSQPSQKAAPLKGSVLLAEDGLDNQRLINLILTRFGLKATLAENGKIALEKALAAWKAGQPFDVILMDMQMPEMDGYAATRALRHAGYSGAIIALTAHAMTGDREKTIEAGCDDYATKPIEPAKLRALLADQLERRRRSTPAEPVPVG